MDHVLTLQWPTRGVEDFDELVSMEDTLVEGLGDNVEVDGHDIGPGEMNIFIVCDEPVTVFEEARAILRDAPRIAEMRAGYRHLDAEDYTALWPEGSVTFEVA